MAYEATFLKSCKRAKLESRGFDLLIQKSNIGMYFQIIFRKYLVSPPPHPWTWNFWAYMVPSPPPICMPVQYGHNSVRNDTLRYTYAISGTLQQDYFPRRKGDRLHFHDYINNYGDYNHWSQVFSTYFLGPVLVASVPDIQHEFKSAITIIEMTSIQETLIGKPKQ